MVFNKIKDFFNPDDEKYEILYHKYSQIKLENKNLKEAHRVEMSEYKENIHKKLAFDLIDLFQTVEIAKSDSFKIKANDKELQRLLMDINKVEKDLKKTMLDFSIEEIIPSERMYDPELHDVASYEDSKGMAKGIIIKTVKKGFKFKNKLIIKPKVIVTR